MEKVSTNITSLKYWINQILNYPYLSIIGVGLVILLDISLYIFKGELHYVKAIIFLSIVPIIFLFIFPFIDNELTNSQYHRRNIAVITNKIRLIAIILLITIALTLFVIHPIPYTRPISFYILFSFAITLLMWELIANECQKRFKLLLLTIILISLALRLAPISMIPGLYFDDPAFHEGFTNEILISSQLPIDSPYTNFPLMHILEAAISDVCGINFKESIIFSITALQASLIPLFVFLISIWTFKNSSYVDEIQVGLLAALIFAFSDVPIRYGLMGAFPTNFATIFFIALLYLCLTKTNSKTIVTVILLLFIALILSHSLTPIAYLLFLFISVLITYMHQHLFNTPFKIPMNNTLIAICTLVTATYLMFISSFHFSKLIKTLFFQNKGVVASFTSSGGMLYSQIVPIHEYFLDALPQIILISIALIGFLFILPRLHSFPKGAIVIGIALIFFGFGTFGLVFGFGNAPDRFIYYSFLLIPIASAFGLALLAKSINIGKVLLIISIITLPFLMISDSVSNTDTPIYSQDLTPQRHISKSEEISLKTIFRLSQKPISADNDIYYFQMKYQLDDKIILTNYFNLSDILDRDRIIVRSYYTSRPIYSSGLYRIDYNIDREIEKTHNKVFNSNSIVYCLKEV